MIQGLIMKLRLSLDSQIRFKEKMEESNYQNFKEHDYSDYEKCDEEIFRDFRDRFRTWEQLKSEKEVCGC